MTRSIRRTSRPRRNVPGPRRVIRVLAEGAVTEAGYLTEWARQHRHAIELRIDRDAAGCAPLTMVQRARDLKRSRTRQEPGFDEIWCVFDVDAHPNVNSAVAEARDAGIEVAVSNPCFELWLVLHLEDQTAHVDRRTIQRRARELGLIAGKSIPESALSRLLIGYEEAKGRAQSLDAMHAGDGRDSGSNPSSGVWKLIESIRGGNVPD